MIDATGDSFQKHIAAFRDLIGEGQCESACYVNLFSDHSNELKCSLELRASPDLSGSEFGGFESFRL